MVNATLKTSEVIKGIGRNITEITKQRFSFSKEKQFRFNEEMLRHFFKQYSTFKEVKLNVLLIFQYDNFMFIYNEVEYYFIFIISQSLKQNKKK